MVPSTLLAGASWALASLGSVSLIAVATAPVVVADYLTQMPTAAEWVPTWLNCFSPMLVYDPADPHATADKGWHSTSSVVRAGDGDPIFGADVTVVANSGLVSTTMAGASVSVAFCGKLVKFYGDVEPGTKVDFTIDGTTTTTEPVRGSNDIIIYTPELEDGNHTVSITLVSGRLAISGANISTPIQSRVDWRDFLNSNKADTVQVDQNDPTNASLAYRSEGYFEYEGRWENLLTIGGQAPNGTADVFYHADYAAAAGYPGASLKFGSTVGMHVEGVNWFQVIGVTTVKPASITIRVDPPPPFGPASTTVDVYRLFATAGDMVFGAGVCDPYQNCTITVTVDEQDADPPVPVPIRAIRVKNTTVEDANGVMPPWASSSPTATATISTAPAAAGAGAPKKTNVGAIAGGVVGGIGALAIIGALVWFCLRRRRKAADSTVTPKSPVDLVGPDGPDPEMARVSPFRTSATQSRLESPPYETPMTIGSMGRHTSYFDTMGRNTSYFDSESGWTETTHTDSNASSGPRSIFSTTTSTRPLHNRNYSSTTDNHFSSANDHETMETVNEGGGPGRDIEQEYDAGRLVEVVPPTYNPAWAAGDLDAVAPRPGHPGYETPSRPPSQTPSQPPSQARSPPTRIVSLDPDTKIWPRNSRQ